LLAGELGDVGGQAGIGAVLGAEARRSPRLLPCRRCPPPGDGDGISGRRGSFAAGVDRSYSSPDLARFSKRMNCLWKVRGTSPVGPFRCFAMMNSASP